MDEALSTSAPPPTPTPQPVVAPITEAAIFLVLTVDDGAEDTVRDALAGLPGLVRAVGFRARDGELACLTGIGAELWDRLGAGPRPAGLHPFRPVEGATHTAPATPGDLLFHIRARRHDLCFELADQITLSLRGSASVVDEVHGFRYFDARDLLGFVDGTENPTGAEALASVHVGDEDPAFAGSSYVIVQKYLHDLTAWNQISVEAQEAAIGRHKLSDVEIPDDEKATNSHVTLTTVTDPDGTEHKIFRQNMAFGKVGSREFGTYFIGYAADPAVTETMLERMFVGVPAGNHDRILDFSTAVTGSLFFVPTTDLLENLPVADPSGSAADDPTDDTPAVPQDGSLGIGGLTKGGTR